MLRRSRPSSAEELTAEVLRQLGRIPEVARVERLGEAQLCVHRRAGESVTLSLDNLLAEVRSLDAAERARRIGRFVRAMASVAEGWPDWHAAAARLMPTLRPVAWRAAAPGRGRLQAVRLVAPFLDVGVAVDWPDSMQLVTDEQLAIWGVDLGLAGSRAAENLLAGGIQLSPDAPAGCCRVAGPDGYASSWLTVQLAHDLAADLLGGPVVALAPGRDDCVFAPSTDAEVLGKALAWAAEAYRSGPRRLSPVPYVLRSGRLQAWQPPAGHLLAAVLSMAEHLLALYEYEAQRGVLQRLFDQAGEDVEVRELELVRLESGWPRSSTSWLAGTRTALLPHADAVVLESSPGAPPCRVPWSDACAVLSELATDVDGLYPPRVRVAGWPEDRLDALRSRAW